MNSKLNNHEADTFLAVFVVLADAEKDVSIPTTRIEEANLLFVALRHRQGNGFRSRCVLIRSRLWTIDQEDQEYFPNSLKRPLRYYVEQYGRIFESKYCFFSCKTRIQ